MLLALAVLAFIAKSQMRGSAMAGGTAAALPGASIASDAGTIEDRARTDVSRALEEGARRNEDAERR